VERPEVKQEQNLEVKKHQQEKKEEQNQKHQKHFNERSR
jgi:hypothetical protein